MSTVHNDTQDYYGELARSPTAPKPDICSSYTEIPCYIKDIMKKIHPEVVMK